MAEELYRVECSPDCGFLVQSHDKEETVGIALEHGRQVHNKPDLTRSQIESAMKIVTRT